MRQASITLFVAALVGAFSALAFGSTAITIQNPGFETGSGSAATDWTVTGTATVIGASTYASTPGLDPTGRGDRFMDTYVGTGVMGRSSSVTQTLTDNILPDMMYTLSIDVGDNAGISGTLPQLTDIRLKDSAGVELPVVSFVDPTPGNTVGTSYVRWIKTYETGPTVTPGALSIELFTQQTADTGSGDRFAAFDNVLLTTPEPASLSLLGVCGLMLIRRRRKCG